MKIGQGEAYASFGEIIQGNRYRTKESYLVTLPIECKTRVYYESDKSGRIKVKPEYKTKILTVMSYLSQFLNISISGTFTIDSNIAEGKGLSSSSADLVAAIRAYASISDVKISNDLIGKAIASVEPSDAVMYDECVLFYNRRGKCIKKFNFIPRVTILAVDEGGVVDTLDCYKARSKQSSDTFLLQEKLLKNLIIAMANKDIAEIGKVCTQSAIINQEVLPKRLLPLMLQIANELSLSGIMVSHTGTYIGLLLDEDDTHFLSKLGFAKDRLKENKLKYEVFISRR